MRQSDSEPASLSERGKRAFQDAMNDLENQVAPPAIAGRLYEQLEEEANAALRADPPVEPIACKAGCSWCCRKGVDVTIPEASMIAGFLEGELPPVARNVLVDKVLAIADKTANLTPIQRQQMAEPCAFLGRDGSCTVYDVRPLLCRATLANDSDLCRRAFVGGEIGVERTLTTPLTLATDLVLGTAEAWRVATGSRGVYELHALLAAVYRRTGD